MTKFEEDVSAAALLFLPFVGLFFVLWWIAPPTSAHLLSSDPLVRLLEGLAGVWAVPILSAVPALGWVALRPPSRAAVRRGLRGALGGLVVVGVGLPILRAVVGATLPAFVPPEESALAGMTLGVGAGILEEAVFRLGILAVVFLRARRVWSPKWAGAIAIVVAALAFALSHELGPGAGDFEARFFATRFLIPGCLMSLLFFRPGPSFLVTLHCAAHVGVALLFTGEVG